jgi:tRNA pseudouridine38-40 synthase
MPFRYFIKLSYNGTGFCGWQVQPNSVTVQAEIEKALSLIIQHKAGITGCGRTDTGVHSKVFFAHFDVQEPLKNPDNLAFKLNRFLPQEISIDQIIPVRAGAHARFSASMREYTYSIITHKDPFRFQHAYFFPVDLDLEKMNEGAKVLMQYSDFECFSKVKTQVSNFRCNLMFAEWTRHGHLLEFTIRSDRFLRNMVRSIVGTLLDLGGDKISLNDLTTILNSRDRQKAGRSVPANGLMLTEIQYPDDIFVPEPEWFSVDMPSNI